jgi:hypothetical protein
MSTENSQATTGLEESFRKYAWDYFALHSDQRMKSFHFFILVATALAGGFFLTLKNNEAQKWMCSFGILLAIFSFVFWKLDQRTRALIKNAERALMYLDEKHNLLKIGELPNPLCLFSREKAETDALKKYPLVGGHFSYTRALNWVFFIFGFIGVIIAFALAIFGAS